MEGVRRPTRDELFGKHEPALRSGDADSVHARAAAGVGGAGEALPHRDAIQKAFGRHDVSKVGAHVGGDAANAAETIGAEAYAAGDQVAFRRPPDLHTAAHEAAHVVQQRAGVQLRGGVGEAGDPYERHADAVADRVVAGESAESLLDASPGGKQAPAVQGYRGEKLVGRLKGASVKRVGDLLEYVRDEGHDAAQTIAHRVERSVLIEFVRAHPGHKLADYIGKKLLTVSELAMLAIDAGPDVRSAVFDAAGHADRVVDLVVAVSERAIETAVELLERVETRLLPPIFERSAALARAAFNKWWPANTGIEAQVSLAAGATVPVWHEPPLHVGAKSGLQGTIKLYNKPYHDAPALEFECASQQAQKGAVGFAIPEIASFDVTQPTELAESIKATTRVADLDWNQSFLDALRKGEHKNAFRELRKGGGNILAATQFEITMAASVGQGAEASAGLGEAVGGNVSGLLSLGLQVKTTTTNPKQAGEIEVQGDLTGKVAAAIGASINLVPDIVPVLQYLTEEAGGGAHGEAKVGGRVHFDVPKTTEADQKPKFEYVEFFVGGEVGGRVLREQVTLASESALRMTNDDIENFGKRKLRTRPSDEDLKKTLPFSQLSVKGSAAIDSRLATELPKALGGIHGAGAALELLAGKHAAGGRVELEMVFTRERFVDLLVALKLVRTKRDIQSGKSDPGPAAEALEALQNGRLTQLWAILKQHKVKASLATFLYDSLQELKLEVHADTSHATPDIPLETVELSGGSKLRKAYTRTFDGDALRSGADVAREHMNKLLKKLLPAPIAASLD